VAIAMATYNPAPELFRRQLDSIRAQTFTDWVCVISDDCSSVDVGALVEGDPRFVVSRSDRRRGFYGNFERALQIVGDAEFVALCDQDDAWHPDKLETLVAGIGDAQLIYSDARLVGVDGAVRAETYWGERDNNHTDMTSLLSANAVSGSASLFRRNLLDLALPFPPAQFAHFHDHWIGLCALARGDIAYIDRPLYDYVQHGGAALGHAAANQVAGARERLSSLRRDPRDRIRLYRGIYFVDVARLTQVATILLMREPRMARPKRRALETFLAADRSLPAAARLWLRGAREYVGRPQTLGAERGLAYAFVWRRALGVATGRSAGCGSTPSRRRTSRPHRGSCGRRSRCARWPRRSRRCG
jgi:GT2 family glycosyltransferase